MVPRKRSKPEGLSALGLLLLWIAIPSFGIGIIVGRRPLERWLSHGAALRKNISRANTPEPEIVSARDESPDITSSDDIDATGAQSIQARRAETSANTSSPDVKTSDATKSFVSTPAGADTKLLNSMSTQELRALKSPVSTTPPENPNTNGLSKVDSRPKLYVAAKDVFSAPAAVVKPVTRANIFAASTNAPTNADKPSAQRRDSKEKFPVTPVTAHDNQSIAANNEGPLAQGFSKQNPSDRVAKTISVDSGVNAGTTNHPGVAPSNAVGSHSSVVVPTAVPRTASSFTATVSTAPAAENSTTHQNTAVSTPAIQPLGNASTTSTQSVSHSVSPVSGTAEDSMATSTSISAASRNNNAASIAPRTQPALASSSTATGPGITTDATPRIAHNVRPSMASTETPGAAAKVAPSLYASNSSRPVVPSAATNLAPVNAQSPLHGVMLVARKNNESFLLRLPVESVAGGRSVSVEMQRFVMVPAESRWHHHGPIAKLTVGELLTQVSPNQVETASNARPGDAVTVRAFVDKNGSVQDLKPVSGRFALMPRVMHEVREWQFDQTLIDGKPVESEVNITVEFRPGPQPSRSRETQAQNSFKP